MNGDVRRRRALVSGAEHDDNVLSYVDVEPLGVEPGPGHTLCVRVAVTLGALPNGWRYLVAFVRGRFEPGIDVTDLAGPADIPTAVSGLGEPAFDWYLGDFDRGELPLRPMVLHAVIDAHRLPREVELAVRVDVSLRGSRWPLVPRKRLDHARTIAPSTFRLLLPADPHAPQHQATPRPNRPSADVRLCMAADIESYSRFGNLEAMRAQERFVELLSIARSFAGLDESAVRLDGAGDSQYAVLPAGIDETDVVPRLLMGIERAAAKVNTDLNERARLRIRVALDRGVVTPSVNGWVGRSAIAVHRLLDSEPLRAALRAHSRRSSAVMISDVLYQDLVRHGYGELVPGDFVAAVVDLPQKKFVDRGWLFTPDGPVAG